MRVEGRELLAMNMFAQEVVLHFQRSLNSHIIIWGQQCWTDTKDSWLVFVKGMMFLWITARSIMSPSR